MAFLVAGGERRVDQQRREPHVAVLCWVRWRFAHLAMSFLQGREDGVLDLVGGMGHGAQADAFVGAFGSEELVEFLGGTVAFI